MATTNLERVIEQAKTLSVEEQLQLVHQVTSWLAAQSQEDIEQEPAEVETWDIEELRALTKANNPKTTRQMVEEGYFGGWGDFTPLSTQEWLDQQRAKRRAKYTW